MSYTCLGAGQFTSLLLQGRG